MNKKLILILTLLLALTLAACGGGDVTTVNVSEAVEAETPPVESDTAAETDENALLAAEIEKIISGLDYTGDNFIREKDFYPALTEILAVHGTEITRIEDGNAYFSFDYANVTSVRLLTMSKPETEVKADIEAATAAVNETAAAQFSDGSFESGKDVLASEDLVTSFVVSATQSQDDQTLMFMAASAALAILDQNYQNTEAAFSALKNNLFALYNNSGGSAVSWIDGLDSDKSYTIPGNGIECWFGQMDDGNYYLAITPYIQYDEIIDIAGASGSSISQ